MADAPPLKVFISSTVADLRPHRQAVVSVCVNLGYQPLLYEDLPAGSADPVTTILRLVDEADIYISIIGFRYSTIALHDDSYVEMEYNRARARNIPCLIFLMQAQEFTDPSLISSGNDAARLESFKRRLLDNHVCGFFTTPEDLALKARESLEALRTTAHATAAAREGDDAPAADTEAGASVESAAPEHDGDPVTGVAEVLAATADLVNEDFPATPPPTAPTPTPDEGDKAAPARTVQESILSASTSDQPVEEDALGFKPYVEALAKFLGHPRTKPPLTLSVEGEWGSGKSSFMLQLKKELLRRNEAKIEAARAMLYQFQRCERCGRWRRLRNFFVRLSPWQRGVLRRRLKIFAVQFNAWRHDKEDALWAAFALEFIRQLSAQLSPPQRLLARLRLLARRFRWQSGWLALVRAVVLTSVTVMLTVVLLSLLYSKGLEHVVTGGAQPDTKTAQPAAADANSKTDADELKLERILLLLLRGSGWVGSVALGIFVVTKLRDYVGDPLAVNLKQHIASPNYDGRVSFVESFHEDFARIIETYAGEDKVYVFIDDLDRCDVPKAADLMQALNLMIADSPQLIFVIGMDREKVAAGLAVKYEKLLPYLAPSVPAAPDKTDAPAPQTAVAAAANSGSGAGDGSVPNNGLEFGYGFIEKFIQLPFRIPEPTEPDLRRLLNTLQRSRHARTVARRRSRRWPGRRKPDARTTTATRADGTRPTADEQTPPSQKPIEKVNTPSGNGNPAGNGSTAPPLGAAPVPAQPVPGGGDTTVVPLVSSAPSGASVSLTDPPAPQTATPAPDKTQSAEAQPEPVIKFNLADTGDSDTVRAIVLMVAPVLDNNPRRLKQFINMFRLKAFITVQTKLNSYFSLPQIGKFVAVSQRWPRLLADLENDLDLLAELERRALDPTLALPTDSAALKHWHARPALRRLLRHGCTKSGDVPFAPEEYSLISVDVTNLLRVSAVVAPRPAEKTVTSDK
ncbi:MAG TPA: P-loop NTPase fold protein [Pyrinomonadaceae bacterium]|jgi:hypothetical protein